MDPLNDLRTDDGVVLHLTIEVEDVLVKKFDVVRERLLHIEVWWHDRDAALRFNDGVQVFFDSALVHQW